MSVKVRDAVIQKTYSLSVHSFYLFLPKNIPSSGQGVTNFKIKNENTLFLPMDVVVSYLDSY